MKEEAFSKKDVEDFIEACEIGKLELVKLYVKKGIDVSVNENEALKGAARIGASDVVDELLKAGADMKIGDSIKCSPKFRRPRYVPVIEAYMNNHYDTVIVFVKRGLDLGFLFDIINSFGDIRMIKKLKENNIDISSELDFALSYAISCGDDEYAKYLKSIGAKLVDV